MSSGSVFNAVDWIAIVLFLLGMLAIVWASVRKKAKDGEDYFLSARDEKWLTIGTSIYTSNIGSEHLVGLAGAGFATGLAMAHWEIQAWIILILGWVFVPIYDRMKVFTMPEFLELRFSRGSRSILSVLTIVALVLTKLAATVYAADVVFKVFLGRESMMIFGQQVDLFWIIAFGLCVATGVYTAIGGLRVIMYTAVLQTPVLLLGSICMVIMGLFKLGDGNLIVGWQTMLTAVGDNIHLVRPLADKEFPWLAVLPGSAIIGFWYWCTDQYIVQRVLAGKNQQESRRGSILAAYLKLTPVFIFMIPGMIAFALTKMAESGFATSGDAAYTSMVSQILPHGIRGIVACGMLASLMASLASKFNASATLFTVDFYQKWHPTASGPTQVLVGRIATGVIVAVSILWIPVMKTLGKNLYEYLQSVQGYMSPAIAVLFVAGIFWKRTTAPAAFWSFLIGGLGGLLRLGLDLLIDRPLKEGIATAEALQGQYGFLFTIQQIHWLYYAEVLLFVTIALIVIISLLTKPPATEKLRCTAYGATPEEKVATRASWNKWDVIHSLIVCGVVVIFYWSFW
ncbi:MAG: sodium:solute symporter [Chitinispirillaceae bacterium]|nr:sodium:solute symporter [Chitinispirillaceae bacterium]